MPILLPEYSFEWQIDVTLRTEVAYWDDVPGQEEWVPSTYFFEVGLGPFYFEIARVPGTGNTQSKYNVAAYCILDGSLIGRAVLGQTGNYDNRAAATFSLKLTAPALRINRGHGHSLLARGAETTDIWVVQGGTITWSYGANTWQVSTDDENLFQQPFEPRPIASPFCFIQAAHNVWPISSSLVAVEASVTPPDAGGVSFRGITDVPHHVSAHPYGWDNSGSVNWQGDADTLRLTLGPAPEGYAPGKTVIGSWFWGEGHTCDFSKVRVARSAPGQGYPTTQASEFSDALLWGGFRRHDAYALDYPLKEDTEIVGTGEFAHGEACPLKLSDIIGLGETVTSNWQSWVGSIAPNLSGPGGDPLTGDFLPALWDGTIRARLDKQWMLDNNWLVQQNMGSAESPDPCYDRDLVVDGWLYDQPDTTAQPWEELEISLADTVDIDLSGKVAKRVTAWTSEDGVVEGGEVDSTGAVKLTLEDAGSLTRTLKSNFAAKVAWVKSTQSYAELPRLYWLLGQNAPTCKGYGTWPNEDVCKWNYAYLDVGLVCPPETLETDIVTLTVQYRKITNLVDSHVISTRRITGDPDPEWDVAPFECDRGDLQTLTYEITGLEPGAQTKQVCLMTPASGATQPDIQFAEVVTLDFPRAGEWQLSSLRLAKGEAAATHLFTHVAEDWRYSVNPLVSTEIISGGLRGRIDNNSNGVAVPQDSYSRFELEPVLPFIDFWWSPNSLISLNKLWTLEEFLEIIENVGNGVTVSEPDWENWYADTKGAAVANDLVPCLDYSENLRLALRCGTYNPAAGLAYKPYMWIALGGAAEGLLTKNGNLVPNENVALTRTGEDPDTPEKVQTCSTDSVGVWRTDYQREVYDYEQEDLGGGVILYEGLPYTYYIRAHSLGTFHRRQVVLPGAVPITVAANLHAVEAFAGVQLVSDCGLFDLAGWSAILRGKPWNTRVTVPDSANIEWANLAVDNSRQEWVSEEGDALTAAFAQGRNGPLNTAKSLGAYSAPCGMFWQGKLYVAAYKSGSHYFLRFAGSGDHPPALSHPATLIGAGDDQAAGLAVLPVRWLVVAAIPNAGDVDLYLSSDLGATWTLVRTEPDLTYPALAWTQTDGRLWMVGYSTTPAGGATGSAVCKVYRTELSSLTLLDSVIVGGSDEGRSALLRKSSDWSLRCVTPKTTTWTETGATPGRAEYTSTDSGKTWELKAIYGES